jgi:uncharacterized protein GlcG (DUF336 family)
MNTVSHEMAEKAIAAAIAKAKEIGSPSSIAVIDHGRELVSFARMDGALLASVVISQSKAYTARSLNSATKDVGTWAQPGSPLYGLEVAHLSAGKGLIIFAGGVPITVNGEVIGAVGVAGGSPDQDHEVAAAGAAVLEK